MAEKSKTISTYNKIKKAKYALIAGTIISPLTPATIITLLNWEEWFTKSGKTLPFGFASLLLTVIVAITGVLKSDTIVKKKDCALYFLAGLLMCIGITCMFLASLLSQMGYMWMATGAGILGSGICVTVEKKKIEPNLEFYKGLIEENLLDEKDRAKKERMDKAKEIAQKEAQEIVERRRRATTE